MLLSDASSVPAKLSLNEETTPLENIVHRPTTLSDIVATAMLLVALVAAVSLQHGLSLASLAVPLLVLAGIFLAGGGLWAGLVALARPRRGSRHPVNRMVASAAGAFALGAVLLQLAV